MSSTKRTEVILRESIPGLGDLGELVRVRPGYARNYLLPRGLALVATKASKDQLDHEQRLIQAKIKRLMSDAEVVAKALKAARPVVYKKAGKEGRLFGSVTNMDIEAALVSLGFGIHRKQVLLPAPIKTLGDHEVNVKIHPHVTVAVSLKVMMDVDAEQDEPEPEVAAAPAEETSEAAAEEAATE